MKLTHAIALDRENNRVTLWFRSATLQADEKHCRDTTFKSTKKTIEDSYPSCSKNGELHRRNHKYLFCARQDNGNRKFDEISTKLECNNCGLLGGCATILAIGHSMEACLTTIVSLYLPTDERLLKNGPVDALTFGAAHIGGTCRHW